MKKQLLSLSLLFTAAAANAQITLTTADVASAGAIILKSTDTTGAGVTIGPGGANMNWNYTGMVANSGSTYTFKNPSTMADYSNYPSSNLGLSIGTTTDVYLQNSSSSLQIVGQAGDFQGAHAVFSVNPPELLMNFPATYGQSFVNTSVSDATVPYSAFSGVIDSARVKSTKYKQVTFDGWGSLTCPTGTFNTLRVESVVNQIDSIWVHSPTGFPPVIPAGWSFYTEQTSDTHNYAFWANGQGFPVLEIDSVDATGTKSITWNLPSAAGIPTVAAVGSYKVYPNPASTNATFDLKGSNVNRVDVYNAVGEIVLSTSVNSDLLNLSTEGLANGLYVARFYGNGQAKGSTRFYISK